MYYKFSFVLLWGKKHEWDQGFEDKVSYNVEHYIDRKKKTPRLDQFGIKISNQYHALSTTTSILCVLYRLHKESFVSTDMPYSETFPVYFTTHYMWDSLKSLLSTSLLFKILECVVFWNCCQIILPYKYSSTIFTHNRDKYFINLCFCFSVENWSCQNRKINRIWRKSKFCGSNWHVQIQVTITPCVTCLCAILFDIVFAASKLNHFSIQLVHSQFENNLY